jgi:Lrp/AsnC family transcriptional regulator for asnA, asnC and gidA
MRGKEPPDAVDWQIIEALQLDGRMSNREIARRLGLSEGTVRARIKRLEQQKMIRITAVTSVLALGMAAAAYVGVVVERGKLYEVADALKQIPEVRFVAITLGQYDIVLNVLVETREELLQLLSDQIATIPGVRRTETTEALYAVKHNFMLNQIV